MKDFTGEQEYIPYRIVRKRDLDTGADTGEQVWLIHVNVDNTLGEEVSDLSLPMEFYELMEVMSSHPIYTDYVEYLIKSGYEVI